jgi:hypothetical protein
MALKVLSSETSKTSKGKAYGKVIVSSDKPVARISKANYSPVAPSIIQR